MASDAVRVMLPAGAIGAIIGASNGILPAGIDAVQGDPSTVFVNPITETALRSGIGGALGGAVGSVIAGGRGAVLGTVGGTVVPTVRALISSIYDVPDAEAAAIQAEMNDRSQVLAATAAALGVGGLAGEYFLRDEPINVIDPDPSTIGGEIVNMRTRRTR